MSSYRVPALLQRRGVLPTCWSRSVSLVEGRAFTHCHTSDHPDRRVTAPQLGARPGLTLICLWYSTGGTFTRLTVILSRFPSFSVRQRSAGQHRSAAAILPRQTCRPGGQN